MRGPFEPGVVDALGDGSETLASPASGSPGDVVDAPTLVRFAALEGHPRFYRRTRITLADGAQVKT